MFNGRGSHTYAFVGLSGALTHKLASWTLDVITILSPCSLSAGLLYPCLGILASPERIIEYHLNSAAAFIQGSVDCLSPLAQGKAMGDQSIGCYLTLAHEINHNIECMPGFALPQLGAVAPDTGQFHLLVPKGI
jgi:hypothetical protein